MKPFSPRKKRSLAYWLLLRIPFWTVVCCVALVFLFKYVPVRRTPLMVQRSIAHRADTSYHTRQDWVPLEQFPPELVKAVILAEDRHFSVHHGFDFPELRKMWDQHRTEGAAIRGCSTISQQTAKNVFTLGTHTWLRKAAEAGWTLLIEGIWGKRRILEVYLNVVETGNGLYGMEAASQAYYHVPAKALDRDQAIALVLCLPNPIRMSPLDELDARRREVRESLLRRMPLAGTPDWLDVQ